MAPTPSPGATEASAVEPGPGFSTPLTTAVVAVHTSREVPTLVVLRHRTVLPRPGAGLTEYERPPLDRLSTQTLQTVQCRAGMTVVDALVVPTLI